jgi:probable HAF family extracellular repeat protein
LERTLPKEKSMLAPLVKIQPRNLLSKGIAFAAAALLSACGGSDWSHPAPPPPPPPPPPPGITYDVVRVIEDPTALVQVASIGINESDMVTGIIFFQGGPSRAFLYDGTRTIDLGDFGGGNSQAFGINRCGHVAGWALGPEGDIPQAFLYDGTLHNIGMPGVFSQARAINDCDKLVGTANFGGQAHAFLYDGSMHDLGTLGGNTSDAQDINAAGVVVGNSLLPGNTIIHAFIYDSRTGGGLQDLGSLGGNRTIAHAINNAGQVTGWSNLSTDGLMRAVRYSGGVLQNLGTLDGDEGFASEGFEINDAGFVVGSSTSFDGTQRGFVYDGKTMHPVALSGARFSEALAINNSGLAVGSSQQPGAVDPHAISWTLAEGTVDLNTRLHSPPPGLLVTRALAVNDKGSIVATTSNNGLVLLKVRH